ncbi:MAG TPA: xanthine dehydrogenase family protein subunit M [Desulfotomaculum sp.]|nr:MAG: Aerobic-type carbon monoxide dehydrogenase, middle subunit CoxM/CutM-like protein [Desulfotomaculum sp. 46_80]HAG11027.1 xanthine dehydrogenase family protein subunit M [Desulfotomaculum sp.]HBY04902.1 xanthine dehydrogenase family protein subunit M [Desulfotomaculum sp.]
MYLPNFEYFQPDSIEETCQLLSQFGSKAKLIAGGTDVIIKMKKELLAPEILVSIEKIDQLKKIEYVHGKGIVIGSGATHNDLVYSELLHEKYLSISEAARQMANNQVRNLGTVGGNIVSAVPSADLPPILVALGATVKITGVKGERAMDLEDVFIGPGKTVLSQDEIITEVIIPDQKMTGSNYIKFGLRASGALAVVGVAAAVQIENNAVKEARIVLGAVSPTPVRAKKAEEFLKDKKISDELLAEAGVIASGECVPITDIRASAEYRKDMVRVFTRRALRKAIDEGHA